MCAAGKFGPGEWILWRPVLTQAHLERASSFIRVSPPVGGSSHPNPPFYGLNRRSFRSIYLPTFYFIIFIHLVIQTNPLDAKAEKLCLLLCLFAGCRSTRLRTRSVAWPRGSWTTIPDPTTSEQKKAVFGTPCFLHQHVPTRAHGICFVRLNPQLFTR